MNSWNPVYRVGDQIRETLESAMAFGERALIGLGVPPGEASQISAEARRRDAERLELQLSGGTYAGRELLRGNERDLSRYALTDTGNGFVRTGSASRPPDAYSQFLKVAAFRPRLRAKASWVIPLARKAATASSRSLLLARFFLVSFSIARRF